MKFCKQAKLVSRSDNVVCSGTAAALDCTLSPDAVCQSAGSNLQCTSGCMLTVRLFPDKSSSQGVAGKLRHLQELAKLACVMGTIDNGCPILLVILGLCA